MDRIKLAKELDKKLCSKCKALKSHSDFSKSKVQKDGLNCWCKGCMRKYGQTSSQRKYQKDYRKNHKEKIAKHNKEYRETHKVGTKEYQKNYYKTIKGHLRQCFSGMVRRCNNLKCSTYKNYGGRGIKCLFRDVDDFINYVMDELGYNTYDKIIGLEVDRIDNNGSYQKGNIRFTTSKVNNNNRRRQKVMDKIGLAKKSLKRYKLRHENESKYRGVLVSEFNREELLKIIDMYAELIANKDRTIDALTIKRRL